MSIIITPPSSGEYPPYLDTYIHRVPSKDLISYFEHQGESVSTLAASMNEEQLMYRYAEGKWSPKDIFVHLIDSERIFNVRALSFARGDTTELPGFEENDYAQAANADSRSKSDIISEFDAVRRSTIELYKSFSEEMLLRTGVANGSLRSVRSMGYATAGHEIHHLGVIKERYLASA